MNECGKIPYATRDAAIVALAEARERFKRSGKGKSWRALHVYKCDECEGVTFHIGRSHKQGARQIHAETRQKTSTQKPQPKPKKIPSAGALKRRLKNIDKRIEGELRHRAYVLGKLIAADAAREYKAALQSIFGERIPDETL